MAKWGRILKFNSFIPPNKIMDLVFFLQMRKPRIREVEQIGTDLTLMNFRAQSQTQHLLAPWSVLYSTSHCNRTRIPLTLPALFSRMN